MSETTGKKEVQEAILIGALSALAVGVVNLGIEEFKQWRKKRYDQREAEKAKETPDASK